MNRPVKVRRLAERDVAEAKAWYDNQRRGLGDDFVDCVRDVFRRIGQTPEMHQVIFKDVRRSLVQRFPYAVYYKVFSTKITVIAVMHTHSHPRAWQRRA